MTCGARGGDTQTVRARADAVAAAQTGVAAEAEPHKAAGPGLLRSAARAVTAQRQRAQSSGVRMYSAAPRAQLHQRWGTGAHGRCTWLRVNGVGAYGFLETVSTSRRAAVGAWGAWHAAPRAPRPRCWATCVLARHSRLRTHPVCAFAQVGYWVWDKWCCRAYPSAQMRCGCGSTAAIAMSSACG